MIPRNTYLAYKRDTRYLLYWMIHTSNAILKSSRRPESGGTAGDAPSGEASKKNEDPGVESLAINTTGRTTTAGLLSMSELIANHMKSIPSVIYRLLQSVIEARSIAYAAFQQFTAANPDEEVEKANASHKHFIDTLTRAFEILGGNTWAASQKTEKEATDDLEEVIFSNKFSALNLNQQTDGGAVEEEASENDSTDEAGPSNAAPRRRQQKKGSSKAKKGKRGKKAKKRRPAKEPNLDDVPLESYGFEGDGSEMTDYMMAVYSIFKEMVELRSYLSGVWAEVAYDGLNSAIAGTVSNMAIAMIKRTAAAIFVDFPGHDSYATIIRAITRGNVETAQGMFKTKLLAQDGSGSFREVVKERSLDVKEQFFVHAYQDLVDFLTDFQKTRSGKPTKAMLAEIKDWDPNFNLQQATEEQRIKWRRSYTINWLYDLVNVFSSIVVQRNTMKGENHRLEAVDWSPRGPWSCHRRLFGLNEFAGHITSLAMQKPGTDFHKRILPHHVFQLQCIVDSMTVSRGWSLSTLTGHVLRTPARGFRARRDVDLFLDRDNKRPMTGYLMATTVLTKLLEKDELQYGDNRHKPKRETLDAAQWDFVNWLGESKYMHGLTDIPPSRFSATDSNGLWEYSPFLCGVGLAEGLEISYLIGMAIWDQMAEPMLLVHLHNKLVQTGYITKPVGLFATLQDLMADSFFVDGKAPTSDFGKALNTYMENIRSRASQRQRRAAIEEARNAPDLHGILNPSNNRFFKAKSNLVLYRMADWNLDRIPDSDVNFPSVLGMLRLGQTKRIVDPATGELRLEETDLVRKARAGGMADEVILQMTSTLDRQRPTGESDAALSAMLPAGYRLMPMSDLKTWAGDSRQHPKSGHHIEMSGTDLLDLVKVDTSVDICGMERPLSSLNYLWVTADCMLLFMKMEDELSRLRNPLYERAYKGNAAWSRYKRVGLTAFALYEDDPECLKTMAKVFEGNRVGFMSHIYWEDLNEITETRAKPKPDEELPMCTLM